ncbi:MAG: ABC transporter ATP-binding protein [Cyclobacteriaceae bacterium]|nr:ABC transporter ATP-binding protein [Cyclobacteriaceae bacterium]
MSDHPLIEVNDVKKHFGATKAVDGVSLQIQKGEFVALLGPNGAGKTTLVEMIEGIQKPDTGSILVKGMNWASQSKEIRKIIGLSLQETHFIDKLRVDETLELFASFYDLSQSRVEASLEMVGLVEKRKTYTKNLSGGQKQKLALGIAFLNQPEILLLDEPTTGLDPTARREVWDILMEMKREYNTAMILTTHYMEEASYLCKRIIMVDHGKILAKGTLNELLARYKNGEMITFEVDRGIEDQVFKKLGNYLSINLQENNTKGEIIVESLVSYLPELLKYIENNKLKLISIECRKMTLDDLFITMTGRHLSD